eukprot:3163179-Pyramimonas_sp.AAC.1
MQRNASHARRAHDPRSIAPTGRSHACERHARLHWRLRSSRVQSSRACGLRRSRALGTRRRRYVRRAVCVVNGRTANG